MQKTYVLNLFTLDSFASNLAKAAWPATLASFVGSTLFLGSTVEVDPTLLVDSVNLHKIILNYKHYNICINDNYSINWDIYEI